MEDKISNTIFLKQQSINELNDLKEKIKKSDTDKIRFRIETKHWYGFTEPTLIKSKDKLNLSKYTMLKIIDKAIEEERAYIDKLIDMEIESRGVI